MPKIVKVRVDVLGSPNPGKSIFTRHLENRLRLKDNKIPILCLGNKNASVQDLKSRADRIKEQMEVGFLKDETMKQLRLERSSLHRKILFRQDERAENMPQGVVLFEQGFYGTLTMEMAFGFSESELLSEFVSVRPPDLVIYLAVDPDELLPRGASTLVQKRDFIERVHANMESMYQRYKSSGDWIKLPGVESGELDGVADSCADRILDRLRVPRVSLLRSF
jgi:hypothetical protein